MGMPASVADPADGAARRLDASARRNRLERAMRSLPIVQREAVRLHVLELICQWVGNVNTRLKTLASTATKRAPGWH